MERVGIGLPAMRRWDESGRLPTCCHPINAYRVYLREDVLVTATTAAAAVL